VFLYDHDTNLGLLNIHNTFNGTQASNVKVVDLTTNSVVKDFVLGYPSGRIQIDPNQYFLIDANARVTEFHGYADPIDNTTDKIIMKYTYDTNGYMSTYALEYVDTPGQVKRKGILQWMNGNLAKLTENDPSRPNSSRYETSYDYYPWTVRNFAYNFPLPEFIYFTTIINAGKNSTNSARMKTLRTVDPTTGASAVIDVTNYDSYTIEPSPNSYVKSFRYGSAGNPYSTKVVLGYKCF
jgi:hypothetical protein